MNGGPKRYVETVALHSLTWLIAGNAVGLLLATLLLFPALGERLGAATYGRWLPLHFDLQLYGWCALPLVGVLLRTYVPAADPGRLPGLAVGVWSASLAFGAVGWLTGHSSGKLFLEWRGASRVLFTLSLAFLWFVLLVSHCRARPTAAAGSARGARLGKWLLLAPLAGVPPLLYWAAGPEVYPAINPDSGGPTGTSLLGSTLGVIAVIALSPLLCGLAPRGGWRVTLETGAALALHGAIFGWLDHGDHSHHEIAQIAGLASLGIWPPLLVRHLRRFDWPGRVRPWLWAFGAWGTALPLTAVPLFLPGVLERVKFTSVLVGHAHLAMAGFVSSFVMLLLVVLVQQSRLRDAFTARMPFALWQIGLVLLVTSLTLLGLVEQQNPGLLYRSAPAIDALQAARWLAGALMLGASLAWLGAALARLLPAAAARPREEQEWPYAA
jgi:cytochrome c oxidase cbb3-type subunit 1